MKKLFRSKTNRKVCGVCGGVAEYFGIDPTLVRLGFLLLSIGWGSGLLAYIIGAIVIPEKPEQDFNSFYTENSEDDYETRYREM